MRFATPLALVVTLALLGGCGDSSSDETGTDSSPRGGVPTAPAGASARSCPSAGSGVTDLRATATSCAEARQVASGWRRAKECDKFGASSRSGCSLLSYRCLASATDRGWSVSCAKPGRSIAFTVSRD
jgi:hypothetical protein